VCLPAAIGNRLLQDVELSLCASTDLTMAQGRLWMKSISVEKAGKNTIFNILGRIVLRAKGRISIEKRGRNRAP
jgi:hypothetical protein